MENNSGPNNNTSGVSLNYCRKITTTRRTVRQGVNPRNELDRDSIPFNPFFFLGFLSLSIIGLL